MFELIEKSNKGMGVIENNMLRNATNKINEFHIVAKNSILAISMILADIAEKPKVYLENSGFNTITEYAETMFNYKKAYAYKLIKISKFISIKDGNGEKLEIQALINNEIEDDYYIDVLKDGDGFEFSPSQMLELIPLSSEQIQQHIDDLDSSLSCKELRAIVKDIVNPPVESTASIADTQEESEAENPESTPEVQMTDKDRLLQMLEICSGMENVEVKEKIVNVLQKALKALEK